MYAFQPSYEILTYKVTDLLSLFLLVCFFTGSQIVVRNGCWS